MDTANRLPAALLLDRDGVINEDSAHYIKSAAEWQPIDGSLASIARITRAGIRVAVCTNQAGVGRGLFDLQALAQIHSKMLSHISQLGGEISIIRYCAHGPNNGCRCRKPQAGLLVDACRALGVEPKDCWFVGDSTKDLQAARVAGCTPVLVRTGNGVATEQQSGELAHAIYDKLSNVADALDV